MTTTNLALYGVAAVVIVACVAFFVVRWSSDRFARWVDQRMAEGDRRLEERRR